MAIIVHGGEFSPTIEPSYDFARALGDYAEQRWPVGRRKAVMAAWRLTEDEARSVVDRKASKATVAKVFRLDRGGWDVALPVLAAVVGHSLDDHIRTRRVRHVETARRHRALARDLRNLGGPGGGGSARLGARTPESGRDRRG